MFVFIVIYNLNISGLVLANIMCYFVVFVINLDKLKSFSFAHFNMLKMFYIVLSSVIMVIVGRAILNILKSSVFIEGVVMITCCVCVYFMCTFVFGILKVSTIKEFILEVKRK
jgi:stage V sporulation protein B